MGTLAYYRSKAQQCRREAEQAIDPLTKESWLQMAASWTALADQAEAGLFGQTGEPGRKE